MVGHWQTLFYWSELKAWKVFPKLWVARSLLELAVCFGCVIDDFACEIHRLYNHLSSLLDAHLIFLSNYGIKWCKLYHITTSREGEGGREGKERGGEREKRGRERRGRKEGGEGREERGGSREGRGQNINDSNNFLLFSRRYQIWFHRNMRSGWRGKEGTTPTSDCIRLYRRGW